MKRLFAIITLVAMCFLLVCCGETEEVDELVVYNWADYIYPDCVSDFEEYYEEVTGRKIEVTYVTFDTNETMLTKLMKGDCEVDIICPSEYAIQKLIENDLLMPIYYFEESKYASGFDGVTGYQHNSYNVDEHIVEKVQESFAEVTCGSEVVNMIDYMVPYMYGTLGILYNKMHFEELGIYDKDILNKANWGILFNDDGEGNVLSDGLIGKIYMKDSIRDSYAATMCYLREKGLLAGMTVQDEKSPYYGTPYESLPIGALINSVDDEVLAVCESILKGQKDHLYGYEVDFGKNELVAGIAYVDLAWSGDALYAVDESYSDDYMDGEEPMLAYFVPHGGGNLWLDGWVVPKVCKPSHLTAAKLFINFLNRADVAASNMMEIGYSSAVSPNVLMESEEAMQVLCEEYNVNAFGLESDEYDYDSEEEFIEDFFFYQDEMDDCNWRYPFIIDEENEYGRGIEELGVMRDFGENGSTVAVMWEEVRSTGISAWGLLGWTVAVLCVIALVVAVIYFVKDRRRMYVKLDK